MAQSLAIEKREHGLRAIQTIDEINKSLDFAKKHLVRDFTKQFRVSKKTRQ